MGEGKRFSDFAMSAGADLPLKKTIQQMPRYVCMMYSGSGMWTLL